jgi:hypothetical protein
MPGLDPGIDSVAVEGLVSATECIAGVKPGNND